MHHTVSFNRYTRNDKVSYTLTCPQGKARFALGSLASQKANDMFARFDQLINKGDAAFNAVSLLEDRIALISSYWHSVLFSNAIPFHEGGIEIKIYDMKAAAVFTECITSRHDHAVTFIRVQNWITCSLPNMCHDASYGIILSVGQTQQLFERPCHLLITSGRTDVQNSPLRDFLCYLRSPIAVKQYPEIYSNVGVSEQWRKSLIQKAWFSYLAEHLEYSTTPLHIAFVVPNAPVSNY